MHGNNQEFKKLSGMYLCFLYFYYGHSSIYVQVRVNMTNLNAIFD